jgi:hypothetical protein
MATPKQQPATDPDARKARRAEAFGALSRKSSPAERAQALAAIGIPVPDAGDIEWSADVLIPTTTDMGEGNSRNGLSPWPTA